jgi:hypothetical protein
MTAREALPGLLKSFVRYYDIKDEGVEAPFAAEAEFHSHEEQFFLIKQAKLSEAESKEFVFFGVSQHLTLEEAKRMDVTAWTRGMSRVFPHDGHRNSDVVLIILADQVDASMLVVRQDYTAACDVNDAADALRESKSSFLGCVLNDMRISVYSQYGYGVKYGYG